MSFKCKELQDSYELCDRQKDSQTDRKKETETLLPSSQSTRRGYDYILVAPKVDEKAEKQRAFLRQLEEKKITITRVDLEDKEFLGLRAPNETLKDYLFLLKVSDSCNQCEDEPTQATRIRIIDFILRKTTINTGGESESLEDLMKDGVFETMFCLHERALRKDLVEKCPENTQNCLEEKCPENIQNCLEVKCLKNTRKDQKKEWPKNTQNWLEEEWARWSRLFTRQPFNEVKCYFGEKVALYYLWLDWYTKMLVPAAVLGVVVFLYGLAFFNTNTLIKEVCESDIVMCPRCDNRCKVWNLSDTCTYAKVSHLFDNEGTVAFAMFMAIWATLFLELWRRQRARYVSEWKVYDWCEEEEELILEIVNDPVNCKAKEFKHSYWRSTGVLILVTLMLMLIIGLAHALVVFRVVAAPLLSEGKSEFISDHANTVAVMLGAVLHYITIQIMTKVNRWVSLRLCHLEKTNSLAATERNFTVKMFTFQFFTLFSSLFYVAFFLGRINGHPGNYVRISRWRLEECHPSGCLTDLFIQMAIIMLLKQTFNNIVEFTVPWFKNCQSRKTAKKLQRECSQCYRKGYRSDTCVLCKRTDWLWNYDLAKTDSFSLFNEFLEMVVQFSFTTIFVAAFPLAPLLALINNIFEIRLDAIKMVCLERRLIPRKTNDIGVWTKVLEAIGVLAVIANGLVIGVSSDFIPRLVYRYQYGPCANGSTTTHCMQGYINDTLSTASMIHQQVKDDFTKYQMTLDNKVTVTQCSYRDYRNDDDYTLTAQFWLVLAVRFAFVILFEHVLVVCKFIAAWFVPSNPMDVKNTRLEEKLKRLRDDLNAKKSNPANFCKSTEV